MASRSQRFNKQSNPAYLNDPHLFYHLESPVKIKQLIDTGMYELHGSVIVEKQSKARLKLSDYTVDGVEKLISKQQKRLEESGFNNNAKLQVRNKSMQSVLTQSINTSGTNLRFQRMTDREQNNTLLPSIKNKNSPPVPVRGLKQFKRKML